MTENTPRPGLWPIPGEGVLARQGDLILLTSTADDELTDGLLALLEKTADTGGDGRQLADAVADLLAGHPSGPASLDHAGPAVVAFGPAGPGLALTISGAANAEISTAAGTQRLVPGPPGIQLRCLLSEPASVVRSELSTGDSVTGHPDRFSRLDQGTTRAGGLVFVPSTPAAAGPGRPRRPPPNQSQPRRPPPNQSLSPRLPPPRPGSARPPPNPSPPRLPPRPNPHQRPVSPSRHPTPCCPRTQHRMRWSPSLRSPVTPRNRAARPRLLPTHPACSVCTARTATSAILPPGPAPSAASR